LTEAGVDHFQFNSGGNAKLIQSRSPNDATSPLCRESHMTICRHRKIYHAFRNRHACNLHEILSFRFGRRTF